MEIPLKRVVFKHTILAYPAPFQDRAKVFIEEERLPLVRFTIHLTHQECGSINSSRLRLF
jgi:hypothetical protein